MVDLTLFTLHYHLIVAWPHREQQYEIVVEGPYPYQGTNLDSDSTMVGSLHEFARACSILAEQPSCEFLASLQTDSLTTKVAPSIISVQNTLIAVILILLFKN